MSDTPQGAGWWLASDGRWYPPESRQPGAPPPSSRPPSWLLPSNVSAWSVAAGYLGLFTFIFCGVPGPFAVFTGIRGLQQIKRQPGLDGTVRCWVGIVLGGLGCLLLLLLVPALLAGAD